MKIFLAGVRPATFFPHLGKTRFNGLLSYAADKLSIDRPLDKSHYKDFILDSGAFTFAYSAGRGKAVDWWKYCEEYAAYVVKNDIKHYMELDVDAITGYEQVLKFRAFLEERTKRPCIPVWHVNRGLEDWKKTCDGYQYVAMGGLKSEVGRERWKYLQHFIDEAHRRGARVHGLGFTRVKEFDKGMALFDTVDSTTWLKTSSYGTFMKFDGRGISYKRPPSGMKSGLHNSQMTLMALKEWIKYADYMENRK